MDTIKRCHSYFPPAFSERASKEYVSHPSHVVLQCDATLRVCKYTFRSIIQRAKSLTTKNKKGFRAEEPVRQHNNGDSLNMKESHVFLLSAALPIVYTERRETHWVQLLRTIWALQSLTHLHCCSRQNFPPAAAAEHHAVMEICAPVLLFQDFVIHQKKNLPSAPRKQPKNPSEAFRTEKWFCIFFTKRKHT